MTLKYRLRQNLERDDEDVWENGHTPPPILCFAVRPHSMGLSVREDEEVLV